MRQLLFLLLLSTIFCVTVGMDGILVTTVAIHADKQQWSTKYCGEKTVLEIDGLKSAPLCSSDGTSLYLTYNGTSPITGKENITILLTANIKDYYNATAPLPEKVVNFTGVFVPAKTADNQLELATVTLQRVLDKATTSTAAPTVSPNAPTPAPIIIITEAHLTINFIHLKYDDNSKKEKSSNNSGAVVVAIIEGIALIAILSYFGYKTMVNHKRKQTANLYGYDNNNTSRITVPDNIRMSDIPPPRSPVYATPATTPSQRAQPPTSQELVVPPTTTSTTTTNPQFSDPFDSLDAW